MPTMLLQNAIDSITQLAMPRLNGVGHRASSFPKYSTPAFSRGLHYFAIRAVLATLHAMILRCCVYAARCRK